MEKEKRFSSERGHVQSGIWTAGVVLLVAFFVNEAQDRRVDKRFDQLERQVEDLKTQVPSSNVAEVTQADLAPFMTPTPSQ